jgi:hypothetical protein
MVLIPKLAHGVKSIQTVRNLDAQAQGGGGLGHKPLPADGPPG